MERQTWANMTDLLPRTAPNNRYTKKATHTKDSPPQTFSSCFADLLYVSS